MSDSASTSARRWCAFTHVFPVLALLASSAVAADKPVPGDRVDDKNATAVRELFTKLGETLADWRQHPEELLVTEELRALRAPGVEPKWVDAKDQGRVVMAKVVGDWVRGWREYDWVKTDIRKMSKRADGQAVEVIAWHLTKAGMRVKIRWTVKQTATGGGSWGGRICAPG